ncbi:MAG: biotin/lipoyl-binding protein [Proteobacteria bacterium]|nr:biotin/lipoyl-binding protein [Pseudomonadota bacterium]
MKFRVQQKGDATGWHFEISDQILSQGFQAGKTYPALKLDENLKVTGELSVRFHADGRSVCIDNTVVQFSGSGTQLKGSDSRIKMGAPATFRRITAEQVKPIAIRKTQSPVGGGEQKSPLTGKVLSVLVAEGQKVAEGDVLLTIEAMKMENRIQAECAGSITNIKVTSGMSVSVGDLLCTLTPKADENGT